jgi:hypothetical protein
LLGALAGTGIGLWVSRNSTAGDWAGFPIFAALAGALTAGFFWWFLLARRGRYHVRRGILAGMLAGFSGHWICWYLLIMTRNVCYWTTGGCLSTLGERPVDPLYGLWGAVVLSAASLLLFGWLTIPLGALLGGLAAAWLRRLASRSTAPVGS